MLFGHICTVTVEVEAPTNRRVKARHPRSSALLAAVAGTLTVACSSTTDDRVAELESQIADARIALLEEEVRVLTEAEATASSSSLPSKSGVDLPLEDSVESSSPASDNPDSIDYAQQYLDWIAPSNCALGTAGEREADITGPDGSIYEHEWPMLGPHLADAYRPAAESMSDAINMSGALEWPDELQDTIDSVVVEMSEYASLYWSVANARTFDDYLEAGEISRALSRTEASLLRSKLGLPTNIGDETDYCAYAGLSQASTESDSSDQTDGTVDVPRYFSALGKWSRTGAEEMLSQSIPKSAAWAYARHLQQGFRAGSASEGGATISANSPGELEFCLGSSCFKLDQFTMKDGLVETFAVNGTLITDWARAWSLGEASSCLSFEDDFYACNAGDAFVRADLTSIYRVNSTTYITLEVSVSDVAPGPITFAGGSLLDSAGLHSPTGDVTSEILSGGRAVWMVVYDGLYVPDVIQMELRFAIAGSPDPLSLWFSPRSYT